MVLRIEDLNIRVLLDIARSDFAGTGDVDRRRSSGSNLRKLGRYALYVENDLA